MANRAIRAVPRVFAIGITVGVGVDAIATGQRNSPYARSGRSRITRRRSVTMARR